jgi:hypothetical protein
MGIYDVTLEDGRVQPFEIEGDQPTEQELKTIQSYVGSESYKPKETELGKFFSNIESSRSTPTDTEQQSQEFEGPKERPFDPNVDYDTGVKNQLFRLKFSNANTSKEKAMFLNKYGKQGEFWDVDSGGRFVLTPQGYQSLGEEKPLKEGKDRIAIDEETLSWTDVTDFIGEAGLPIAGSIAGTFAALATGPVAAPLLVASIGSGLGAGLGSLADEAQQAARGIAAEDALSVGKRAGIESIFGFAGEYAAGTLFNAVRRLIKGGPVNVEGGTGFVGDVLGGKGATAEQIAKSKEAKQLVDDGYKLDVTVENLQNRPILGINVKVLENLFPGRIDQNANQLRNQIQEQLFDGRDFVNLEELGPFIKNVENQRIKVGDEYIKAAEKDIQEFLTVAYDNVLGKVNQGYDPSVALKDLSKIQQAFHTTVDDGFRAINLDMSVSNNHLKKIGEDLGLNNEQTEIFVNTLNRDLNIPMLLGDGEKAGPRFIKPKQFVATLNDAIDRKVIPNLRAEPKVNPVLRGLLDDDLQVLDLEQLNVLRSWVNTTDAEILLNGKNSAKLFREVLDEDIMQASADIKNFQDKFSKSNLKTLNSQIDNVITKYNNELAGTDIDIDPTKLLKNDPKTRKIIKDQLKESLKKMSNNMDNVETLQRSYKDFMTHQDDAFIRQNVKSIQGGSSGPEAIAEAVLSNPNSLAKFFTGLRKAQSSQDAVGEIQEIASKKINPEEFTEGEKTLLESFVPRAAADETPGNVLDSGATAESITESKTLADELFKTLDTKNNTPGEAILASERDVYNVLKRRQDRIDNNKIFQKRLNETLPELENRAIESLQKEFIKRALNFARDKGTDKVSVNKFTEFIKNARTNKSALPELDKTPGVNDIDFIKEDLRNKSVVDILFPDGQGSDLLDAANQLNKATGTEDIVLDYNTLTAFGATPNTGGRDVKQLIEELENQRKFIGEVRPEVQKKMLKQTEGLKDGVGAFNILKRASGSDQAEYFQGLKNQIDRLPSGSAEKAELIAYERQVRDRLLVNLLNTNLSASGEGVEGVLDLSKLNKFIADLTDKSDGAYTDGQLDVIFGWGGPRGEVTKRLKKLGETAETVSEKGGARKVRTTGLQTATLGTDIASGEAKKVLRGATKLIRLLTIAGVVQSKPYVKWALTPPKTLAQMGKSRVAIRTAIIESLSDVTGGGVDTLQEDISEASQALEIPEKTKQAKDFAEEQVTSIVEETPISMPTPRRIIPSPEQISMSGPAQQMSANIGNVERDIALGAAGNNPTMQALLRATRGQA